MNHGPCGPLGQVGTGLPPESADGLCGLKLGPAVHDLYVYQGDDWVMTVRWEDAAGAAVADLTGAAIKMQVRAAPAPVETDVLFEAEVGDGITISDGPNATFVVALAAAKTVLLNGSKPFVYDLQVIPSGGALTTILRGKVYFDLEVTT